MLIHLYQKKNLIVNIKSNKNQFYLMTTTQVNSSLLRTGNKKHTTSFLRCRGVL